MNINYFSENLIAIISTLVSYLLGIVIYFVQNRDPKPCYQLLSYKILDNCNLNEEIDILFKGKKVEQITQTFIFFWNAGRGILHNYDIVPSRKFDIHFTGECLKYEIIKTVRNENNFTINASDSSPNNLEFGFNFLGFNDGVTLSIIHTGSNNIKIIGDITHVRNGINNLGEIQNMYSKKNRIFDFISIFFYIYVLMLLSVSIVKLIIPLNPVYALGSVPLFWLLGRPSFDLIKKVFSTRTKFPKSLLIEYSN
jgi:hypothetical protein